MYWLFSHLENNKLEKRLIFFEVKTFRCGNPNPQKTRMGKTNLSTLEFDLQISYFSLDGG